MRQEEDSGILHNATELRELLKDSFITDFQFDVKKFKDIIRLNGMVRRYSVCQNRQYNEQKN
jgi:hypothetical protein